MMQAHDAFIELEHCFPPKHVTQWTIQTAAKVAATSFLGNTYHMKQSSFKSMLRNRLFLSSESQKILIHPLLANLWVLGAPIISFLESITSLSTPVRNP